MPVLTEVGGQKCRPQRCDSPGRFGVKLEEDYFHGDLKKHKIKFYGRSTSLNHCMAHICSNIFISQHLRVRRKIGGNIKILYCPEHIPGMDRVTKELASLDIDTHSK
jgi:hypothetical protein